MGNYIREIASGRADINGSLGEQIGPENNNFLALSFSQKMLYKGGLFVSYSLNREQFQRMVRSGRLRSGINPRHTFSIQAARDLLGLDLEVEKEKPIVRIEEPGDSVTTMQTDAPKYLLQTSRTHYYPREILQARMQFRRFEYIDQLENLPEEVLSFLLQKYLVKRKALAYC